MERAGQNIVVMGMGLSGRAAARLAVSRGASVVGVDLNTQVEPIEGVRLELGPHRRQTFLDADCIVVSPGIPPRQPDLAAAAAAGVPIVSELDFAAELLTQPMAAVTGTNGKSTVTWFVGQLLEAAGLRPFVGGNLGRPLSLAAMDPSSFDVLVVECSSYQLEWSRNLTPKVGVVLNLTPDHLARHGTMEAYAEAKARVYRNMGPADLKVLPGQPLVERASRAYGGTPVRLGAIPGVTRNGNTVEVEVPGIRASLDVSALAVPGEHNKDNAATAALVALALGADEAGVQAGLNRLQPLEHRMQIVRESDGVRWINDSKATNVDATRVGLSGLDQKAVVLLGGKSKGPGFAVLKESLAAQQAVICFGGDGPAIADELEAVGLRVERVAELEDAVQRAAQLVQPGQTVLLSPGCASFDAFDNFEHRGRVFADLVNGGLP